MIAGVFLISAVMTVLGYWLFAGRLERKERAVAVHRVAGPAAPKAKTGASAPALIQMAGQMQGLMATRLLERLKIKEAVERQLETAALKWGAAGLAHRSVGLFLAGFVSITLPTHNSEPLMALAGGAVAAVAPFLYVRRAAAGRLRKFEEQFPDCLEFISRSMRAGHAFSVSLDLVHREFNDPLAGEFRRVFEEQNLGQPLEIVLRKLGQRMPSMDVQFFVSAVLMQKRTGGNLAELLDGLAELIRQRFKLRARVRAISAMGMMSGRVLAAIPAIVAALMLVVNRPYVRFFVDDPAGHQMLAGAIGLQLIGYLVIRKIVTIEV
ncbi:MAG TPA: type II secretion system F family protein [Bryobacteraceae bacterium]|nr:type II secretion system F family protein [Bryobacteraceae bacterium]